MEQFPIKSIQTAEHFPQLQEIPECPSTLQMRGSLKRIEGTIIISVVGSRKCTSYGKEVCASLIKGLAGYPVTIVSGLAHGIDAVAHQSAIDAGLPTIAFPGSGLNWSCLYPKLHTGLSLRILESDGALLSEFEDYAHASPWTFPRCNRLKAGVASIVLVIEASEKSGSLATARLATEYNKTVCAVPGPANSPTSVGTNWLLKCGAIPVTSSRDILRELNLLENDEFPFLY